MMKHVALIGLAMTAATLSGGTAAVADEKPRGPGMTETNQERLVLDDMEDITDWHNGSPDETKISSSDRHRREGRQALLFANIVDHTKGEKNYPIGWPRTGKNLGKAEPTDWSAYDRFECWIHAETSRDALPKTPLGVGFYHPGHKRSRHFRLTQVKKDAWVKVEIPIKELLDPADVRRIQFNISESDYKHGDRVDFHIDRLALVRYIEPAVAALEMERKILFSGERSLRARYKLVGYKGLGQTRVELAIGRGAGPPTSRAEDKAAREGEITVHTSGPLAPGTYQASLDLRNAEGKLIDRRQSEFRVIAGPFAEDERR